MVTFTIKPESPAPLTPGGLRAFRERVGWSAADLAVALGCTYDAVRRWEVGERKIPGPVRAAVGLLAAMLGECAAARPDRAGEGER